MKNLLWTACVLCLLATTARAQLPTQNWASRYGLDFYLPQNVSYNANVPSPAEFLGYMPGEYHVSHDQMRFYMMALAESSNRVTLVQSGASHEGRPTLLLTITHPQNQANIAELQAQHVALSNPEKSARMDISNMPAVVWMGYSIHGNEASGANASLLMAYYLAAAEGADIEEKLKKVIVLLDPCYNPDGVQRFSTWVNMHRSTRVLTTDPNDREYDEAWPGGRTNHYWFDLNRDWLPTQHPESQGRIAQFHAWKPNVLTDHHEMGTNSTFFFQPGIPSRNNPLTPDRTYELTEMIAERHGKFLDEIGSLYYSKESFDDYYFGKGSTYPDANGAIGILFEQASARGHVQESEHGLVTFPFAVRNQLTTSLSTYQAAYELRTELLEHQREFYRGAMETAKSHPVKAYAFGDGKDPRRTEHLVELILRHDITVHRLGRDVNSPEGKLKAGESYIVSLNQPQHRLIRAMFERPDSFEDSLFYDVSAWTFPLSFNMPHAALQGKAFTPSLLGEEVTEATFTEGKVQGGQSSYAYLFEWHGYYAPRVLYALMAQGIRAEVATEPFKAADGHSYDYGTILVPVEGQRLNSNALYAQMQALAKETGVTIHGVQTGLNPEGYSLGSPIFSALRMPKVALLVGNGVYSYEAGEVWHLMDTRYQIPITKLQIPDVSTGNLKRYNVLLMVNGSYGNLGDSERQALKAWVRQGGVIVGTKGATRWLANHGFSNSTFNSVNYDQTGSQPYVELSRARGAQAIGGSIFQARLDLTHPLCYGYSRSLLPVFRNSTTFMQKNKNPYANPVRYEGRTPILAGYISDKNAEAISGTVVASVSAQGRGRVVSLVDNPNFRAFWYGTNKLYMNAIFFGHIISSGATAR